jgi:beta-lactam-binding protein with PASTA domain
MLTHPPLLDAHPGDPITSEGWNNLVQSVKTLYDALNTPQGTLVIKVADKASSAPVTDATVSVVAKAGSFARGADFVGGAVSAYVATGIPAGTYSLVIEAPGYSTDTRDIEVAASEGPQEIAVQLVRTTITVTMPNLFGLKVNEAQLILAGASLSVGRILDSHGNDIPPAAVPVELLPSLVLNQVPPAGVQADPKVPVLLHISAKVEVKLPVKVPNLMGMTYAEAATALEAVGLKLAAPITAST